MALICIHVTLHFHTPLLGNTSLMPRSFDPAFTIPHYMHKIPKYTVYGTHAFMGKECPEHLAHQLLNLRLSLELLRSQPTPQEPGIRAPRGVPSACIQVLRPAKHRLHIARIKRHPPPVDPPRS